MGVEREERGLTRFRTDPTYPRPGPATFFTSGPIVVHPRFTEPLRGRLPCVRGPSRSGSYLPLLRPYTRPPPSFPPYNGPVPVSPHNSLPVLPQSHDPPPGIVLRLGREGSSTPTHTLSPHRPSLVRHTFVAPANSDVDTAPDVRLPSVDTLPRLGSTRDPALSPPGVSFSSVRSGKGSIVTVEVRDGVGMTVGRGTSDVTLARDVD